MIQFHDFTLDNGLRVIVHQDKSTPIVAFNLLYKVGAKNEDENRTGFAHLFEHLMFGGSVNIPSFDEPLQEVGGENNAFTSNDLTNYYITLPKNSLEVAFWLESDRMLSLAFTPSSLEVQRKVVIEEFKQRYLNQPYGDAFLLLRPLAYKKHPYQWATIGKEIAHIEEATMEEVKAFFYEFYRPNNAILSVAGDVTVEEIKEYSNKWFGDIEGREMKPKALAVEEPQREERKLTVERDIPLDAIYKAYHMVERTHKDYYATDLLSDILSRGNSSRFHQILVKEKQLFTEIDAYITGDVDPGLFIIAGKLFPGVNYDTAEMEIAAILNEIREKTVAMDELQKVKNKVISSHQFSINSVLNKAMGLAIATFISDSPDSINREVEEYNKVTAEDIQRIAASLFQPSNCSTLYYKSKQNTGHDS